MRIRGYVCAAVLGCAASAHSQSVNAGPNERLFVIGEVSEYAVRVNGISAGTARLSVDSLVDIRGRPAYKASLTLQGRVLFFSANDRYETWVDTSARFSYRFRQDIKQTRHSATRSYEIYPESLLYSQNDGPKQPSVAEPLDELALVFFLRTQILTPDSTYRYERYFRPDRNPVLLEVLRKEKVSTPMGIFDCIVVRPRIKARGIFSEQSRAEVWISDGPLKDIVQIKTRISVFSVLMTLKDVKRTISE